jgi:hypothetical protein
MGQTQSEPVGQTQSEPVPEGTLEPELISMQDIREKFPDKKIILINRYFIDVKGMGQNFRSHKFY